MDYFFVPYRQSTVALAAVLNAMQELPSVPPHAQSVLLSEIKRQTTMNVFSVDLDECRARLHLHYVQGGYACPSGGAQQSRDCAISPVSVTHGVTGYYQHYVAYPDASAASRGDKESRPH